MDITPLEDLNKLTKLYLGWNQITDVKPLGGLVNLTLLHLNSNQISCIAPLNDLVNLTEFDLGDNQVTDITSLHRLTNLTLLNLGHNQLTDITPLNDLVNLTKLELHHNLITNTMPLTGMLKLEDLRIDRNFIDFTESDSNAVYYRHVGTGDRKQHRLLTSTSILNVVVGATESTHIGAYTWPITGTDCHYWLPARSQSTPGNLTINHDPSGIVEVIEVSDDKRTQLNIRRLYKGLVTLTIKYKNIDGSFTTDTITITDGAHIPVTGVTVSPATIDVIVGATGQLTATALVTPSNATNQNVNWSSSDTNIATVDSNGSVTVNAGAVAGNTVIITATTAEGNFVNYVTVNVVTHIPVTGVTFNPIMEIGVGGKRHFWVSVTPWNATNRDVTLSIGDSSIATIDKEGLVQGVGVGTTKITITLDATGAKIGSATVIVIPYVPVTNIMVIPSTMEISVGRTGHPFAVVLPFDATNRDVTWSSAEEKIATVNYWGTITGEAEGTTTITATSVDDNTIQASVEVTVRTHIPVTGVTIFPETMVFMDRTRVVRYMLLEKIVREI